MPRPHDVASTPYYRRHMDTPQPDGDELLELGWFTRDAIFTLPRRDWIDRVISDCR